MLAKWFRDEIEACRPGSRDIDQPEMSQLADALVHDPGVRRRYEAVQRLDARIGEAFAAVPIPAGLADRLLSGLEQAAAASGVEPSQELLAAPEAEVPPVTIPIARHSGRRITRRRLALAAAAAVLLSGGVWALRSPADSAGGEDEAAQWYAQLADVWQPLAKAPADLAIPAAIVGNPRGWQVVARSIARHGVVYQLTQGVQARAALFVLAAKRPGLPTSIPLNPQSSTGGVSIGAWQSQGLVYVLVVSGDQRAYRRFVPPGRQPLAVRQKPTALAG